MKLEFDHAEDGVTVIRPQGRLNVSAASTLRDAVKETVTGGGARIVVDLAETAFIDSSGLGALIAGLKAARSAGGDLRIARPGEQVRTVLELTNLHKVLKPYATVQAAFGGR